MPSAPFDASGLLRRFLFEIKVLYKDNDCERLVMFENEIRVQHYIRCRVGHRICTGCSISAKEELADDFLVTRFTVHSTGRCHPHLFIRQFLKSL